MRPRVAHVVVPVHDEADALPACLDALDAALAAVETPGMLVRCTVVLDRCTDASADLAHAHAAASDPRVGWHVLEVAAGGVGAARAAGVDHARALAAPVAGRQVWVATTDADSRVPSDWLVEQTALAAKGHDLVIGPVVLDHDPVPGLRDRWQRLHRDPGRHVFGANLGVRLTAYDRVDGFPPVAEHEDVELVTALRAVGVSTAWSSAVVRTSARLRGRTPGGLAGYLRALAGPAEPAGSTPRLAAPVDD